MEKKKVTKEKNETKLSNEKQNLIKNISRIIYIAARVIKVLAIIAIVCLLLLVIVTPVIVKNIRIEDNTVTILDKKLEYKEIDGGVELIYNKHLIGNITNEERIGFDTVINELSKQDMTRSFVLIEISLMAEIAIIFLFYFIMINVEKFFVNIHENEIPFTDENCEYLNKISYLALVSAVISFVTDAVSTIMYDYSIVGFNLLSIIYVSGLYCATYIFEYACILQKQSKTKMYITTEE